MEKVCVLLLLVARSQAGEYVYDAQDITMTKIDTERFRHNRGISAVNSHFKLTVEVTPTSQVYPHSGCPILFTKNPDFQNQVGFSLGHGMSTKQMELRMSDGSGPSNQDPVLNVMDGTEDNFQGFKCVVVKTLHCDPHSYVLHRLPCCIFT